MGAAEGAWCGAFGIERGTGEAELVAGRGNKDNTTPTLSECGIESGEAVHVVQPRHGWRPGWR